MKEGPEETFLEFCHACALVSSFVPAATANGDFEKCPSCGPRVRHELEKSPADGLYRSRTKLSRQGNLERIKLIEDHLFHRNQHRELIKL